MVPHAQRRHVDLHLLRHNRNIRTLQRAASVDSTGSFSGQLEARTAACNNTASAPRSSRRFVLSSRFAAGLVWICRTLGDQGGTLASSKRQPNAVCQAAWLQMQMYQGIDNQGQGLQGCGRGFLADKNGGLRRVELWKKGARSCAPQRV